MELQHVRSGHFTGVADLERALGPMMPERTFLAWEAHFQAAARPTVSFLTQEWTRPFGLLLDGPEALGASVAWKTHRRDKLSVRVAAITPLTGPADAPSVSLKTAVVCGICNCPMKGFGKTFLALVGPRGVLNRPIFPACRTCSSEEDVRALLAAAQRKLTASAAPTLKIIRGGGQGDGTRNRDHLRLVLRERAAPETDKP